MTATLHNDYTDSFASLLRMLDVGAVIGPVHAPQIVRTEAERQRMCSQIEAQEGAQSAAWLQGIDDLSLPLAFFRRRLPRARARWRYRAHRDPLATARQRGRNVATWRKQTMIGEAELRRQSAHWNVDPMVVDLDYGLGWFIAALYGANEGTGVSVLFPA